MRATTRILLAALVFFLAAACAATSDYDPQFDRDLVALRDKVDLFLAQLEQTAGTSEGAYSAHEGFYDELWVSLDALRQRAEVRPTNGPTSTSLAALAGNLRRLEALHRQGLTPAEVPVLRKILGPQFDALSAKGKE
jgi:hypothetical protein